MEETKLTEAAEPKKTKAAKEETLMEQMMAQVMQLQAQVMQLQAQAAPAAPAPTTGEKRLVDADPEEKRRVKIKLFKDNDKYRDALYVSINNYNAQIPRGVEVDVPYYVAKHIEEMERQDAHTAALIEAYEEDLRAREKELNLV